MARERFINPATGTFYDFEINHSNDDAIEYKRNIERTANTSGIGLVRQQGSDSPIILRVSGTILSRAQRDQMSAWWALSRTQTIHYRDFTGSIYEVLITAFNPTRQRVAKNPRGGTAAPHHKWTYTMEMELIRTVSGAHP